VRRHYISASTLALAFILAVTALALAGCSGKAKAAEEAAKQKIVVGSKVDTEGELLSSIIKLALEDAGLNVTDKSQTGTTEVVRKALIGKEIDIYPEYTGSGMLFFGGANPKLFKKGQEAYDYVKLEDFKEHKIVWLTPAKANNTWAIATTKAFAEKNQLTSMSDFAAYVKASKPVKVAASDEFFTNPGANPAFEAAYGYKLAKTQEVRLAGGNTAQTEKAVADGTNGVNFAMAYGTDGALADLGLVVLEDDKSAQPVYWPTPVTRQDVIDKHPQLEDALVPAFESLTLEKLQELNARIQVKGESADAVAKDYLKSLE
jgi:osmoprotectant transport system substrate-binding protein